jgi:hypothetical protein
MFWVTNFFGSPSCKGDKKCPSGTAKAVKMVQFTTEEGVDAYTNPALQGITIGIVVYGQLLLAPNQYSLTGDTITIDPGLPVEGGLQLVIIPT